MRNKIVKIGIGGLIMGSGLAITAAMSPVLWVTAPTAAYDALQKLKRHPCLNNSAFEVGAVDIALALSDSAYSGLRQAIAPLRGSLDIALLGAVMMTDF